MALEFGLLVGGILTVMLYSRVFYKDTIVYELSEHILLGTATGYVLVTGIKAIINNAVTPMQLEGKFIYLIPMILGLTLFFQLSKKTRLYSRIPLSIIVGVGLALTLRRVLLAYLIGYIKAAFKPIAGVDMLTSINNILILVGSISALMYFIMSKDQTGTFGYITKIGRAFLMVTFGAYMGTQEMSRFTLLAGRIEFVIKAFNLIAG